MRVKGFPSSISHMMKRLNFNHFRCVLWPCNGSWFTCINKMQGILFRAFVYFLQTWARSACVGHCCCTAHWTLGCVFDRYCVLGDLRQTNIFLKLTFILWLCLNKAIILSCFLSYVLDYYFFFFLHFIPLLGSHRQKTVGKEGYDMQQRLESNQRRLWPFGYQGTPFLFLF